MRTVNARIATDPTTQVAANAAAPSQTALIDTAVAVAFDDGSCLLGNGLRATRAVSCLVEPRAGDRVLASHAVDGACHVLHILARAGGGMADLSVPGCDALAMRQARIAIHARESLHMGSAGEASVTAAGGTLSLNGRNLFSTATDTAIDQAGQYIGKYGQYLLEARELLRLHGDHALITASKDVKVDAERISMG